MRKNKPTEVDVTLGANLRRQRILRGLTQEQLAEASGITFQQIQKYENASNRIATSRLVGFCRALGCGLRAMFDGIDVSENPATPPQPMLVVPTEQITIIHEIQGEAIVVLPRRFLHAAGMKTAPDLAAA